MFLTVEDIRKRQSTFVLEMTATLNAQFVKLTPNGFIAFLPPGRDLIEYGLPTIRRVENQ
jgi:hypothetical protein